MKTARLFAITLIFAAVIFLFFFYRADVRSALQSIRGLFAYENYKLLILENERLSLELKVLRSEESFPDENLIVAQLYSRYPFNDGGKLIADAGKNKNVVSGEPVLVDRGVILGKVKTVSRTQSEIETVFDPSWRSSVFVGRNRTKAVLEGGSPPALQFIPATAMVETGDEIINASPEFPLNLFVGKVKSVESSPQNPWLSATVEMLYTLEDLKRVLILKNFP